MTKKTIKFHNNHMPSLTVGDYELKISQNIGVKIGNGEEAIVTKIDELPMLNNQTRTVSEKVLPFTVAGPRFDLDSSLIHSVYPPIGNKGDHDDDLPSIVLNRNTLPWERSPEILVEGVEDNSSASWLYLLLIDEDEEEKFKEFNDAELDGFKEYFKKDSKPDTTIDSTDLDRLPTKISYLEVEQDWFTKIVPNSLSELEHLSFSRVQENDGVTEEEKSVIVGNRLPAKGKNSTVYLVSLENNYVQESGKFEGLKGKEETNKNKFILPYLHKWSFHSFDTKFYLLPDKNATNNSLTAFDEFISNNKQGFESTEGLIVKLKDSIFNTTAVLNAVRLINKETYDAFTAKKAYAVASENLEIGRLYENSDEMNEALKAGMTDENKMAIIKALCMLPASGSFHGLLSNIKGGVKPFYTDPENKKGINKTGAVKIAYNKNEIQKSGDFDTIVPYYTSAFYRGPIVAQEIGFPSDLIKKDFSEITVASQLIIKFGEGKEEDTSYSAAFELGKLTALDDTDFSREFYAWKNELAIFKLNQERQESSKESNSEFMDLSHLPISDSALKKPMPVNVRKKFLSWKRLHGIPYRYLVPNPDLLPDESIRFFKLDQNWIKAFICGAFSIGNTVETKYGFKDELELLFKKDEKLEGNLNNEVVSGFLINSMVVSGWPEFEVDVQINNQVNDSHDQSNIIRNDNLDVNTKIYLCDGNVSSLKIHLPTGKTHFGFLTKGDEYLKQITNAGDAETKIVKVTYHPEESDGNEALDVKRVVNFNKLHVDIEEKLKEFEDKKGIQSPKKMKKLSTAQFASELMQGVPTVIFNIGKNEKLNV